MPKDLERLTGGEWYELGHKGWIGVSREGCRVLMDSWGREPGNIPVQGALLLSLSFPLTPSASPTFTAPVLNSQF